MILRKVEFPLRITRAFLLVILCLSAGPVIKAQSYSFYKINNEQGLSSAKVYTILQDRNDYVWLGTDSGLDRFDGLNIESITPENGIWHGGVYSIFEDSQGLIWFGHLDGKISYYNGINYRAVDFDTLEISGDITSIFEYQGRLWFTTYAEGAFSFLFDEISGSITSYRQYIGKDGLSDLVSKSYIDPDGNLYCITDAGIKIFDNENDVFRIFKPEGLSNHFSTITMLIDSKGTLWVGTNYDGLMRVDAGGAEPVYYDIRDGLAANQIMSLTEDSRGRLWAGAWNGGITVIDGDDLFTFDERNGLEAKGIRHIIEDEEGNMLIATHSDGLNIFKGDYFVNYSSDRLFKNKDINAVSVDKYERLWFGNINGVTILDPETGISWRYNTQDHDLGNDIVAICNDLNGNIWLASRYDGIYKYDYSRSDFRRQDNINARLPVNRKISSMVVDSENNLWIGTDDGVIIWSIKIEEGLRYTQSAGLAGNQIQALYVDGDGTTWIGSSRPNGLTRSRTGSAEFEIIDLQSDIVPKSFLQTDDGTLWIGTTRGVFSLEGDTLSKHITVEDGLLSNDIQLLIDDGSGNLYIGTNNGLNRYNLSTGRMITYTENNGFTGIQANPNACARSKNGFIWFGTVEGVSCLKPERIPETDKEPLTHIEGLTVMLEPFEMEKDLRLSYKENSLVFDYYSICITNPEAVRYRVMLEGAEPGWSPETQVTRATYPSLSPGKYVFKVKAFNSNGVWNTEPETFAFTIKPPFYFSAPFIISMAILIIIAIYVYIRIRERNLVMEKQILEEKVEERTAEVVEKSKVIEEKNRDITASIRYAERIQMAMLPPEDSFKETFVLFKPKDIVSGDFYWMYDNGDIQFLAAVDCTGHGVPGAFMSIIGSNSLTKIVREYNITQPAAILDQLNSEVTKSLLQRGETVINDGMDLALISYDKRSRKVEYAGAYNPLVIVRDGQHISIKADRFPIGMAQTGKKKFTNNEIEAKSGDMLYMFSDGYADQFGGADCKKFKILNLKNEFLKIYTLPVEAQKDHLVAVLEDWRGNQPQIDDILVIGTRIP
ncbi:MAG: two-component regulator propeller domain-containing protein [Marinilabiliaceae bacterium]|jgi:ligand-binding sensor domain-containing protein/serine phosphatase RsbU (regulator of sigma subunit)|nr:two-component regulator propeller domain-containing protein [Marinilabiliaceae bacterium]